MKLSRIGANQTCINHIDGTQVFFSYDTPVAGYSPELGYVRTKDYYSRTTSRHINQWLRSQQGITQSIKDNIKAVEVSQNVINNLAEGNGYIKEYTEAEKMLTTLEELSNA